MALPHPLYLLLRCPAANGKVPVHLMLTFLMPGCIFLAKVGFPMPLSHQWKELTGPQSFSASCTLTFSITLWFCKDTALDNLQILCCWAKWHLKINLFIYWEKGVCFDDKCVFFSVWLYLCSVPRDREGEIQHEEAFWQVLALAALRSAGEEELRGRAAVCRVWRITISISSPRFVWCEEKVDWGWNLRAR